MPDPSKKDLQAQYKAREVVGGIYAIVNNITGGRCIDLTTDIKGMENRFLFAKSSGSCVSLKLQSEWNQYGAEAFSFEIIETLKKGETQSDREFHDDIKALFEMYTDPKADYS